MAPLQPFSAGSQWTPITFSYTVGSAAVSSLRVQLYTSADSVPLQVDQVSVGNGSQGTNPLPHPESGWLYLWDDAFGVPGLHLWEISAQVDVVSGEPGLGVSATTYQDPSKMPQLMSGTDWIEGQMALNISETDPCFLFEFDSDGGDSGVSVGTGGVFEATDFAISFAPRGCQVGPYTLQKGAFMSFDALLGDGTVDFSIAITEGPDGPEFTEDVGIADITIGGIDFKQMDLDILMTPTDDSITFVGNMMLPMGSFYGSYDLTADDNGLQMDGAVELSDWQWAGGGFDVQELDFSMSMSVPFGVGQCGSFDDSATGYMTMAKKTGLSFTGQLAVDCGKLEVLELDYDYWHNNVSEVFELDYSAATGILSGEVGFQFDRSTSWRFFFHRYNRHPYFDITLSYSMDVAKPGSAAEATLDGTISVSGGSGTVDCTIVAGTGTDWQDDQCSLSVHIDVFGGHTYSASW
jgi:hypothetical protein